MTPDDLHDQLTSVFATLTDREQAQELARLLRRVCHDVNNALGTLSLEHYSVGAIIGDLGAAVPKAQSDELTATLANAEEARDMGEKVIAALHRSARTLDRAWSAADAGSADPT